MERPTPLTPTSYTFLYEYTLHETLASHNFVWDIIYYSEFREDKPNIELQTIESL